MKKVVITGGHLTPAVAVIEELLKDKSWEIIFFGRRQAAEHDKTVSIEEEIIKPLGINFIPIASGRIQRRFTKYTLFSILKIPVGFIQSFYWLLKIKPKIILSFGGYLSVPVVMTGWLLKIPIITHEQTTVKGLATKIDSLFAKRIAISWKETVNQFPKNKVIITGNPTRPEILTVDDDIWSTLNFDTSKPLLFITGGNQGSHVLNNVMMAIIPDLLKIANIFHQCGHLDAFGDFKNLEILKANLPKKLAKRYHVKKYLSATEMGTLLNKADLIISRSGANTVTELAVLAKPAILIPHPWNEEQLQNARLLSQFGGVKAIEQKYLTTNLLLQTIREMLKNLSIYKRKSEKSKNLVDVNAAKKIVSLINQTVDET